MALLGAVALGIWLYLWLGRGRCWRMADSAVPPSSGDATVVAVIPARNEATVVGGAIASLAGQCPIVLVDDASDDGTANIALKAGEVQVISARPLPSGWT